MIEHITDLNVQVADRQRMIIHEEPTGRTVISYQYVDLSGAWVGDTRIGAILPTDLIIVRRTDLNWQNERMAVLKGKPYNGAMYEEHYHVLDIIYCQGGALMTESGVKTAKMLVDEGLAFETGQDAWPYRLTLAGRRELSDYMAWVAEDLEGEGDEENGSDSN